MSHPPTPEHPVHETVYETDCLGEGEMVILNSTYGRRVWIPRRRDASAPTDN